MTYNQKTVNTKLQRIELCDLMIACTSIAQSLEAEGRTADKWNALHDKLDSILKDFDNKHEEA